MQERQKLFSASNPKLYKQVGEEASKSISRNFEAQGRPKWQKRKYSYEWPILWKTGRMRARAERTALEWLHHGKTHINKIMAPLYGIYHQYGTKKLPVRKFAQFPRPEVDKMKDIFRKAFLRGRA